MIGVILVLAHCGCYVPAHTATIPICQRLFTRANTSDDLEHNASSFKVEMEEVAYLLENANVPFVALIDELGRSTSTEEGVSIAYAVCESLLESQYGTTFFVTHYHELCQLSKTYIHASNFHFSNTSSDQNIKNYQLIPGPSPDTSYYGIQEARESGIPKSITDTAEMLYNEYIESITSSELLVPCNPSFEYLTISQHTSLLHQLLSFRTSNFNMKGSFQFLALKILVHL